MIRNEETYKQVIEFRKRGFTYTEIAKICGISKSTASNYLSKKKFSKAVAKDNAQKAARENKKRMALLNKARKTERATQYREALHTAETEYRHYKHSPLFIAGLSLYMADGDIKDLSRIRVSSTNTDLHRIFIHFLQDFIGVEECDITFIATIYTGMDEAKQMKWWSKGIKLSVSHFGKTQFLKTSPKHPTSPQNHGSGSTILDNTLQKKKLLHWIHLLQQEL
jgi:predicted transcriptional regulator